MPFRPPRKLNPDELREYAIRLLAGRAMSVAQLKERLRRRASDAAAVEEIVVELKAYGALNDRRFAESFSSARATSGAFGRQRVLADLLKRKVAPKVAERAVREAFEGADEEEAIARWLERKYRNMDLGAALQAPARLASVYRRLRQAGFGSGPAIRVLKRYASAAEQLEALEDGACGPD